MTLQARIPRRRLAAALGACLLAAPAAAQQMDTTRWIRVDDEAAEALLTDIFRTVSVASDDPVQRVIGFRRTLEMMDEAHLGFLAVSPKVARVYIDVMNPLSTYIRVRAETSVFAPMD